jgi:lactoylglutathione lyase
MKARETDPSFGWLESEGGDIDHEPGNHSAASRPTVSGNTFRPTIAQIEQIALATNDLGCLSDFYEQLGAMASPPFTNPETGLRSCVLDFCGVRLELFERSRSWEGAAGVGLSSGLLHLGFALGSADAVDELSGVFAAAGHRVLEPPHRNGELGSYESVVLDPEGNRLKLMV